MNMELIGTVLGVLAVPLLVLLNAFFVSAEFALVAVRRTRVDEMINHRRVGAAAVRYAVENLDDTIAATQLGITLASLALGWVGEPSMARLIVPLFTFLPAEGSWLAAHTLATILAFALITFLHVILGELAPKAIALERPDAVSLWVARPLLWFSAVMRPAIAVMNATGNGVVRMLGFEPLSGHQMVHSVEELGLIIEETRRAGILPRDQAEYVRNVFRLPAKRVRDCLVPRERMASLDLHMPAGAHPGGGARRCAYPDASLRGKPRQHRGDRQHEGFVSPVQLARHGGVGRRDVPGDFRRPRSANL